MDNSQLIIIFVQSVVTIVGFIINYIVTNKSIKEEINKKKIDITLNYLSNGPILCLELFDIMLNKNKNNEKMLSKFTELSHVVVAYGSEDAIKILSKAQQYVYRNNFDKVQHDKEKDGLELMAYYTLLTCQIKYDLTGIKCSPEYWYKIKITDFENRKTDFIEVTNKIVKRLDLKNFLKI